MTTEGPGPVWVDSHCHVQRTYLPDGSDDLSVLSDAAAAGVESVVCVGTDATTSAEALAFVDHANRSGSPVRTFATVGLHPHDASNGLDDVADLLERIRGATTSDGATVVAVGECGLDYHYDHSPRDVQRDVFAAQLELAKAHDLAVVVHTRQAWEDTVDILRSGAPERIVIHCFTGGPDEVRACLALGAYVSFSGIVTFANARDVREAAAICPPERLLVETDAPFLAPVPHRGETNRPSWVSVVGEAVAAVKGCSPVEIADSSRAATYRVFGLE
ncbi:MAG TPA: TatD family hydrolase [Acidimicrobiales bacterium]|nr:TatD family hydrolase [Acidimicrobiales bacterium]